MISTHSRRRSPSTIWRAAGLALQVACTLWATSVSAASPPGDATGVRVFPAPDGETLSKDFIVQVDGLPAPVYTAKVAAGEDQRRWKAMDDIPHSGDYAELASFACFEMTAGRPVTITVSCPAAVRAAKLLPSSYRIAPTVAGRVVRITLTEPRALTLEVNGEWVRSLHLFASAPDPDAPRSDDPNVIYFGRGIHEVREGIRVTSGKTLYVAGGAILRGVGAAGGPVVSLIGDRVALRGRGIIDGANCPTHTRNLLVIRDAKDVVVDGVILRDSSTWNVPIRKCDRVTVHDLKVFGCRANSDGIDVCNSRDVTIDDCFLRTLDDLVVVKSDAGQGPVRHVVVRRCVLWNQVAHALSIGAELREPVEDVLFADCDVIHDVGREWTLRVFHCDSTLVSNVRFEDIRVEQSRKLISVWIGKQIWSRDAERGRVRNVLFKDIVATSNTPPRIELIGFDAGHGVDGVTFEHVLVNGKPLASGDVKTNEFVKGVVVRP